MEGNWCSGKFCAAYPTLRKPVPPSRTKGGVGYVSDLRGQGEMMRYWAAWIQSRLVSVNIPIGGGLAIFAPARKLYREVEERCLQR